MVFLSVCEGMGVCLPVRGPMSGRVGLCWDSQLLHGAVPGRAAGLFRVYWQPVCVSVYLCLDVLGWVLVQSSCSPPQLPSLSSGLTLKFATKFTGST